MDAQKPLVSGDMTPEPITLSPEDTLLQALETMPPRGVPGLPVTVGGSPIKVADSALVDILRAAKPAEPA